MRTKSGKIRVSYTLTLELLAFIAETRQRRNLRTNSEALDSLLREAMLKAGKAVSQAFEASMVTRPRSRCWQSR